ncbi:MAG: cupin domain-containing protein [Prochloraceae cyanobacterium]|nr:cupin domain-containing protein [Prochloraceae cyanobacterium]
MSQESSSNDAFTKVNFDFNNLPYLSNPWRQLNLHAVAIGLIKLPQGEGYTFTHSHAQQEEVYIVIEGRGQMLLDGELVDIGKGDLVRVSPQTKRALKANEQAPLLVICAGGVARGYPENPNARYLIDDGIPDYDDVPPWYRGNQEIIKRNNQLKERMLKSQQNRQQNL